MCFYVQKSYTSWNGSLRLSGLSTAVSEYTASEHITFAQGCVYRSHPNKPYEFHFLQ
jgi:hypothetical protein